MHHTMVSGMKILSFGVFLGMYVSVHKLERKYSGSPILILAVITENMTLDIGETKARYGSVSLSG